jgi:hypothetical protein
VITIAVDFDHEPFGWEEHVDLDPIGRARGMDVGLERRNVGEAEQLDTKSSKPDRVGFGPSAISAASRGAPARPGRISACSCSIVTLFCT